MRASARGPTVPGGTFRLTDAVHARIEAIYREEYGRVVASLARRFGDLDIAEDAAGEALVTALEKWPPLSGWSSRVTFSEMLEMFQSGDSCSRHT